MSLTSFADSGCFLTHLISILVDMLLCLWSSYISIAPFTHVSVPKHLILVERDTEGSGREAKILQLSLWIMANVNTELACLGRPFQLGMLYDCRSDSLIPAVTLWDLETLKNNLDVRPQPNTEFNIIASDDIEDKANSLNVTAALKGSFLGGLVQVEGSAKFMNDRKKSEHQARVTLQYSTTTTFEQLTMTHLGRQNVSYPYVFDQGTATHVVTAVLYGAQAFFLFDREVSSSESLQDIQGSMEVSIKIIPKVAIEGDASLKMKEEEKENTQKFSCTFYGDFALPNNPTTFEDAMNVYSTLPQLLGQDGKQAVPVKVWLYPLNQLDSKAAQLVRDISINLVNRAQAVLEQINDVETKCSDMMKDQVSDQCPEIKRKIKKFRAMCVEYKQEFQKALARVLPSIRGGGEEEGKLVDILKNMEESPFRSQSLTQWLDNKNREMSVVRSYLSQMNDIKLVKSRSELDMEILDMNIEYVICFMFTSLHQEDLYLLEMAKHLRSETTENTQLPTSDQNQWIHSVTVSREMRKRARLFLRFHKANKEEKNRSQAETSCIIVYEVNHQEGFRVPFSLTIVDIPRFADASQNKHIPEYIRCYKLYHQIKDLFSSQEGVKQIDALCLVVQAYLVQLTSDQECQFSSFLSMFSKDVTENIHVLVTFADRQVPPVLEAIAQSDILCPKDGKMPLHFRFNTSAVFTHTAASGEPTDCSESDLEDDNFHSMKQLFAALRKMETKTLKEVLQKGK
uniref:Stonustoxin subunit alpha-like n=1 Tax=Callorhinchus milii TaxID=7868 RepID=A0A4W3IVF9_CALMI